MGSASSAEPGAADGPDTARHARPDLLDPTTTTNRSLLTALPVAALVVLVDQLTKIWAVESLGDGDTIDLFWTLRFKLVRNEGAAFSQGESFTPVIAILSIAVAVGVVVISRRTERRPVLIALGLVLGGAVGNVIDRLFREGGGVLRGAVVDFIDFQWWPVFNVADIGIVVGGLLLVLLLSEPRA